MKGFFFFLLIFLDLPEQGEKNNLDRKIRVNENCYVWELVKVILVARPFNIRVCPMPCVLLK